MEEERDNFEEEIEAAGREESSDEIAFSAFFGGTIKADRRLKVAFHILSVLITAITLFSLQSNMAKPLGDSVKVLYPLMFGFAVFLSIVIEVGYTGQWHLVWRQKVRSLTKQEGFKEMWRTNLVKLVFFVSLNPLTVYLGSDFIGRNVLPERDKYDFASLRGEYDKLKSNVSEAAKQDISQRYDDYREKERSLRNKYQPLMQAQDKVYARWDSLEKIRNKNYLSYKTSAMTTKDDLDSKMNDEITTAYDAYLEYKETREGRASYERQELNREYKRREGAAAEDELNNQRDYGILEASAYWIVMLLGIASWTAVPALIYYEEVYYKHTKQLPGGEDFIHEAGAVDKIATVLGDHVSVRAWNFAALLESKVPDRKTASDFRSDGNQLNPADRKRAEQQKIKGEQTLSEEQQRDRKEEDTSSHVEEKKGHKKRISGRGRRTVIIDDPDFDVSYQEGASLKVKGIDVKLSGGHAWFIHKGDPKSEAQCRSSRGAYASKMDKTRKAMKGAAAGRLSELKSQLASQKELFEYWESAWTVTNQLDARFKASVRK